MPHKKERFSEDWTLLQLHRQYGKDEAFKHLFDEISKLKFEIGALKSELSEKEDLIKRLYKKQIVKVPEEIMLQVNVDERVTDLKKMNKIDREARVKAEKEIKEWRNKYLGLLAKAEQ